METDATTEAGIYFEVTGQGPPIVLGHSFLCDGAQWREQVRGLAGDYRLINLDLRGHGRSAPVTDPFTLYDAVDDVVDVLDQLGIERAIWCGLSIGGMVAMRAALTVPERVERLIIMDSDAGIERLRKRIQYWFMAMGVKTFGLRPFLNEILRLMFGESTRREQPDLVEEWRHRFAAVDVPSTLTALVGLTGRDSILDRLADIRVPSLVLVGEEDASLPVPISRRIHDALPNSQFIAIPKAGHLSALEQPELVNEAIRRFLMQGAEVSTLG